MVAVQERQDHDSRRRRRLLRLVRRAEPTSRACSSTARTSRSRRSCSPAIPNPLLGGQRRGAAGRPRAVRRQSRAAAARRGDRRASSRRCRATCGSTRCSSVAADRTCCAASTSTRRSPTGCDRIRRRARSPRFSRSRAAQFDALSVNLNYARPQQRLFVAANYTFGRSVDDTDSPFSLPADNYNLAAERGPALGVRAPPLHEHGEPAAEEALPPRHVAARRSRARRTTSPPAATTTATRSATIGRPASRATARSGTAQIDLGLRLSWGVAFGGAARRRRRGRRSASSAATAPIRWAAWAAATAAASDTRSSSTRRPTTR